MSIAEKLTAVADNQQKVYDAGKQAEYDRFWDAYQQNGNRANYDRGFGGEGWNAETFKPKYLIRPTSGNMYMTFACSDVGKLDESVLDTSQMKKFSMTFYNYGAAQGVYHVEIDISSLTELKDAFNYNARLETVVLKNVPETCDFINGFQNCANLKNLTVTGTIGGSHLNLQWSALLTKASILSILDHLLYECTGSPTVTLNKSAVDKAFETAEGALDGSESEEWLNASTASYDFWTFALV